MTRIKQWLVFLVLCPLYAAGWCWGIARSALAAGVDEGDRWLDRLSDE